MTKESIDGPKAEPTIANPKVLTAFDDETLHIDFNRRVASVDGRPIHLPLGSTASSLHWCVIRATCSPTIS